MPAERQAPPKAILAFRCQEDGHIVIDTAASLRKHLGHNLKRTYPKWWERWLLSFGWRP